MPRFIKILMTCKAFLSSIMYIELIPVVELPFCPTNYFIMCMILLSFFDISTSVPVDHTFFLANFCTTTVASTMKPAPQPAPNAPQSVPVSQPVYKASVPPPGLEQNNYYQQPSQSSSQVQLH